MAKWKVGMGTVNSSLQGSFEYDAGERTGESRWQVYQDERPFLEEAKRDRENSKNLKRDTGYKKFATIPDIVAIEILEKYKLDLHSPTFFADVDNKKKFMQIIKTDYPHLMAY